MGRFLSSSLTLACVLLISGAVVAESGGMLSHSSIVAREYRIPCVVSVPGATKLPDGATVVVDGYTGTVVVEDGA